MTDEFEQAVRRAAQGLASGSKIEQPTYHDAWQRGRRRRFRKQAGIAFAGAFVLLAALTVNLGDFPGGGPVDETEVAIEAQPTASVSASPEFVPTTAPVVPPTDQPTDTSALTESTATAGPGPAATSPQESAEPAVPVAEPTSPPAATAVPAPSAPVVPAPTAAIEEPAATATTEQAAPDTTDSADTASPDSADTTVAPEATLPPAATFDAAPTTTAGDGSATQTGPADPDVEELRTPDEPGANTSQAGLPNVTFIGPNQRADAIVLAPAGTTSAAASELPCDLDRDGTAEATCTLKPAYTCTDANEARPGYLAIDLNEDGDFDQCVALDATACDTVGDGLADTPCTIELQLAQADPEDS